MFYKVEEAIIGSVPHTLGFVVNELSKNAFILAFEGDLMDLKDLVDPESIDADDFELLENVNDPVVQLLLVSVDRVITCMTTYYLINGLDELEVMENEEFNELASDYFYAYIIDWESRNYGEMVTTLNAVYLSIAQLLYHATCQLDLKVIDVPDHIYDDFFDKYSSFCMEEVPSDNKNISLLNGLIHHLNGDLLKIDKLSRNA
ncbi:hypothetical protein [Pedobacter sp. JCM 36344]|uniref:hypothetical protein n=1 Tax=Pedobacter sp. JCM 36344 TaxID=3374280 RepID=UPI0039797E86